MGGISWFMMVLVESVLPPATPIGPERFSWPNTNGPDGDGATLRPNCELDVGSNVKGEEMFIRPIKFSLVEVSPLGGGLDAPGIGTASKEGGARTGGGMAVCAGSAGREKFAPTDFSPLGGVDILDKKLDDRQFLPIQIRVRNRVVLLKIEVFVCVSIAPD